MLLELVVAEPPEPLLRGMQPAIEIERQEKALEQVCDGARLAPADARTGA